MRFWKLKVKVEGEIFKKVLLFRQKKNNNINPQSWNSTNIFIITLFSLLQKMDKVCPFHPMGEKTTEVES